ncbi:hypothetical protein Acor_08710 [Acrocarpospora corrugata]|uniref:Uncharacterized protein n=1 Tax=Acrocarpospora corrugata TaxID=35763 RepID=A0A5M3VWN2_9ACTN|nr:hypothetical protein [Acrocarpospora corrugata]GER98807.1 hypothetical protein Acor_08710 [Acrocarpospora corrugata]
MVDYFYAREENGYCGGCGVGGALRYDRGGYLSRIEYGHNSGVAGSVPAAQVVFNAVNRGTPPSGHGGPWFDDTPGDLNCVPGSTSCQNASTAFYITKRLDSIVTSARLGTGPWDEVARYELGYKWVASHPVTPGGAVNQLLWLDRIKTVGLAGDAPDVALPVIAFDSILRDNRADHARLVEGDRTARLSVPRVAAIANGLGGRIEVPTAGRRAATGPAARPAGTPGSPTADGGEPEVPGPRDRQRRHLHSGVADRAEGLRL